MMCSNLAINAHSEHCGILYRSGVPYLPTQVDVIDMAWRERVALSLATALTEHQWRLEQHFLKFWEGKQVEPVRDMYSSYNICLVYLQQVS